MKVSVKILFIFLLAFLANGSRSFAAPIKGKDSDSASSLKSNIAIFKMITSPVTPAATGKSLKKAGSVARTSNSHTTVPVKTVPEG